MKKARIFTMILCIAAAAIISGFINIFGGTAIIIVNFDTYGKLGIALLISSVFLILGTILACFEKIWLPIVFNIIGTASYIYTVCGIYAIPNSSERPKIKTEALAEKHLFTIIVTVLLALLTILNFFTEKNVKKREEKRLKKFNAENRKLTDNEKLL